MYLSGGSVPVFDEVILSLSLMNNVISLDELAGLWPLPCCTCVTSLYSDFQEFLSVSLVVFWSILTEFWHPRT